MIEAVVLDKINKNPSINKVDLYILPDGKYNLTLGHTNSDISSF